MMSVFESFAVARPKSAMQALFEGVMRTSSLNERVENCYP
jgi:hypothetical protein